MINRLHIAGPEALQGLYCAPPDDLAAMGSKPPDRRALPQLVLDSSLERRHVLDDYQVVKTSTENFMTELHNSDRHAKHNQRILNYLDEYSIHDPLFAQSEQPGDYTSNPIRLAVINHDFIEHTILRPEVTARKCMPQGEPEELEAKAKQIKSDALALLNELHQKIEDKDSLEKANQFAIDASKWEIEVAQKGRVAALSKIDEKVKNGEIGESEAVILRAAIENDKDVLRDQDYEDGHVARILKANKLLDLDLETISLATLKYNFEGLLIKGVETLDLLKNPPPNNPASTYRDCIEVLNVFVPALTALGFKKLATDLRGAALEFFHDDPHGYAKRQRETTLRHHNDLENIVIGLRKQRFGGLDIEDQSRVKTEGSIREKRERRLYPEDVTMVPDGDGFAFILPDGTSKAEIELFAKSYQRELLENSRIVARHPNGEATYEFKDIEEDMGPGRSLGGYQAVNMNFYYIPEDGSGDEVPFEVQVMTQEQAYLKLYGRTSDLLYKSETAYSSDHETYFAHLRRRAQAVRENLPGSTIYSIAEMVATSPELPSVYNELFRAVETPAGGRILVPKELEKTLREIADYNVEMFGVKDDLTILPPVHVTEKQLIRGLKMLSPRLAIDKNILNAIMMVKRADGDSTRNDGKTSVLTGHIYAVALAAAMSTTETGKQWDNPDFDHHDYIAHRVTVAILHDYVEKSMDDVEDINAKIHMRELSLIEIKQAFGPVIKDAVDALTLPVQIENDEERRDAYTKQIFGDEESRWIEYFKQMEEMGVTAISQILKPEKGNAIAQDVKPKDRHQNHTVDLARMANDPLTDEEVSEMLRYFRKTDQHLSVYFMSNKMSAADVRQHQIIWRIAEHFGYARY